MSSASESQIAYLSRDLAVIHSPLLHISHYFAGDPFTARMVCVARVLQPVVRQRCCGSEGRTHTARVLPVRTHKPGVKRESLKQGLHAGSNVQVLC